MLPVLDLLSFPSDHSENQFRDYLLTQNRLLSNIVNKNSQTLKQLENILKSCNSGLVNSPSQMTPGLFKLNEILDYTQQYNCKLTLTESFPVYLCKSKYFKLTVQLLVEPGTEIMKSDRTSISVTLYSYDLIPKIITHTMQGKSIFRGKTQSILAYDMVEDKHLAHFKLQIKEVSSHFIGGLFYLAIEPDRKLTEKGIFIRPLVIGNVRVKAKEL